MQARIGTPRCYGSLTRSAGNALTCIFLCLALSSCSLFRAQKKLNLKKSFDGLCLTSNGKGRIEHSKGRHLFNYESLWEAKVTKWSLAFNLPVIGQELLALQVRQEKPLRLKVTGTFARRLKNDVREGDERILLNEFYSALGQFLLLVKNPDVTSEDLKWEIESKPGELLARYELTNGGEFSLKAFDFEKHFRRMKFSLRGKKEMSLDLFVYQCSL